MKKNLLMSFALLLISISTVKAQSLFDKIDRAVSKIDGAANSAEKASQTGNKVGSLFGKKKKQNAQNNSGASVEANTTVIKISNINLTNLKKLNSIITTTQGVTDSKMKYSASASTITVAHSGSTEKLLEHIQPQSKSIFIDSNIENFDEGRIEIKLK
ncbi:hypothetical protein [Chryseobacterium kwangjuense]|uniref:Uncharacterized protein n=1 Tax=Chryseobacterium kwangjuense TaxID=267125 RepID=A0A135WK64_9FLAO|nr:hypothetical protein [Chryseobacterium kwangjuense]KXH85275.1 hypothetical protein AU378_05850 [Chryseobacterium kwangjuense]